MDNAGDAITSAEHEQTVVERTRRPCASVRGAAGGVAICIDIFWYVWLYMCLHRCVLICVHVRTSVMLVWTCGYEYFLLRAYTYICTCVVYMPIHAYMISNYALLYRCVYVCIC